MSIQLNSQKLIEFCWNITYDKIPSKVMRKIKECILDHVGVVIGGIQTALGRNIFEYSKLLSHLGSCSVLGYRGKVSVLSAAFTNGSLSEVLELQDGWRFGNIHPCVVIPAAFAIGEEIAASGKEMITAVVAGYEVANRIAYSMHPAHLAKGFLPSGTAGSCGAAMAAAKMMDLDLKQTKYAVGIAGFILPVSTAENLWEGYSIKPIHSGQAAKVGIEAAYLAKKGFKACPLEGSMKRGRGWCEIMSGPPQLERLVKDLGSWYTVDDVYFKFYPICRHAQSAGEAALKLSTRIPNTVNIKRVIVKTYELAAKLLNRYPHGSIDQIPYQFSIPYVVAYAILRKNLDYLSYTVENLVATDVQELAKKVEVISDDKLTAAYPEITPSIVEVYTESFFDLERCDKPKGDPRVKVSNEELNGKYIKLTNLLLGREGAFKLKSLIEKLEALNNLNILGESMREMIKNRNNKKDYNK